MSAWAYGLSHGLSGLPSHTHVPLNPDTDTVAPAPVAQPAVPRQTLQVFNKKVQKKVHEMKPRPGGPGGAQRLKHT